MGKSLQTAKIEELLKTYKVHKGQIKEYDIEDPDFEGAIYTELFWIKMFIKDLKWLLDDTKY